jgi:CRP-like cAMP-binding protein
MSSSVKPVTTNVDASQLAIGLLSRGLAQIQRSVESITTTVVNTLASSLDDDEIDRILSRSMALQGQDASIIHELALAGTRKRHRSGEIVFYEDNAADALYLVLEGSVFLLRGESRDEVVDQLGPGSMIGDIALVLRGTRTATARAASALTLLRLKRLALDTVREGRPAVTARIWRNVGFRLLSTCCRVHPHLAGLSQVTLHRWYDTRKHRCLRDGESLPVDAGSWWWTVSWM